GGLGERDGDLRRHVLAAAARRKVVELEGGARPRPAGALAHAAEHVLEDVVDAAEATAARAGRTTATAGAAKALRSPGEGLESLEPAGMGAHALEAAEARLALGVDLAAVERLALVLLAQDFIGGVELGEPHRRLGVVPVGVRMQLLGQAPEGFL